MLIGIDASRITTDQKTGPERYAFEIIKRLVQDRHNNYILWSNKEKPQELAIFNNTEWKIIRSNRLWTQSRLAREIMFGKKPDVIFIPSHVIPYFSKSKFVVMIHDLAFDYYPDVYTKKEIKYQKFAIKTARKKAKKIITPSETTKKDLVKLYGFKAEDIEVIYHGIDEMFFDLKKNNQTDNLGFGITKPYILYVGRIESKKNIINLIKSYYLLRQESKVKHKLVLVGKKGYGWEHIQKEIENLPPNISRDIIETDFVSDETLKNLYANADIFVLPSFYEGFGFAALEAMATGIPTIVNKTPSLKELVKYDNAVVDMRKPFPLAAKLSLLINHPLRKTALGVSLKKRAKEFNWDITAQKTLKALQEVGEK